MHETGIVRDLVRRVLRVADDAGAIGVSGISVWLGALSQFSPAHFREHFDDEARGTIAAGAALRIEASSEFDHPDAQSVVIRGLDLEVPESQGMQ